jgi:hypothetical protein
VRFVEPFALGGDGRIFARRARLGSIAELFASCVGIGELRLDRFDTAADLVTDGGHAVAQLGEVVVAEAFAAQRRLDLAELELERLQRSLRGRLGESRHPGEGHQRRDGQRQGAPARQRESGRHSSSPHWGLTCADAHVKARGSPGPWRNSGSRAARLMSRKRLCRVYRNSRPCYKVRRGRCGGSEYLANVAEVNTSDARRLDCRARDRPRLIRLAHP